MEIPVWDSRAPIVQDEQQDSSSARPAEQQNWPRKISRNNCNTVFCFLSKYSVLVCKQHGTGVINLDRHLREQHGTPIAVRREVVDYFAQFAIADPKEIEVPEQLAWPNRDEARVGL
jgi:hypothetical protein